MNAKIKVEPAFELRRKWHVKWFVGLRFAGLELEAPTRVALYKVPSDFDRAKDPHAKRSHGQQRNLQPVSKHG
jgi:hypothetical protein